MGDDQPESIPHPTIPHLTNEREKPIFDADGALTREFLLKRGYCCGNGCRNCPYGHVNVPPPDDLKRPGRWRPTPESDPSDP